jgi:hypothetical protein
MILEYSNIGEHLITRKTPPVTIVAACNRALTGVGPSIASGNHVCNPICADLPMAPIKIKKAITSINFKLKPKNEIISFKKKGIK